MRDRNNLEIPATLLYLLSQSLEAAVGLHFPREKWHQLADAVGAVAGALGFEDAESCAQHLVSAPLTRSQIEILAPLITVGETYFFRDTACFAALEQDVLPSLIQSRRGGEQSLRIWSAGCATGEEPYSIAILLERLIPDIAEWRITLQGTDVNPALLQKASAGIYSDWSYRNAPTWLKEGYFRRTADGRFEIHPRIRQMVSFSYLNLAEDSYPSASTAIDAIDMIFCRNVLMYFAPHRARTAVQRLYRALDDGGWLVLSAAEVSSQLCSGFSTISLPGVTLYRKDGSSRAPIVWRDPPLFHPLVQGATGAATDSLSAASTPAPDDAAIPDTFTPTMKEHEPEPAERPVPESPDAPYEEAQVLYEQGQYSAVVAQLADLLPRQLGSPDSTRQNAKPVALLARSHANLGQLAEALRCCEIGVALDKMNPASHYLLATVLQELGREAEAVLALRRALYLDHDFVLGHFALGNLARQRGRLQEAIRHFRNAEALLERFRPEDTLPESDGMTVGSLKAIIRSLPETETSG